MAQHLEEIQIAMSVGNTVLEQILKKFLINVKNYQNIFLKIK